MFLLSARIFSPSPSIISEILTPMIFGEIGSIKNNSFLKEYCHFM